MAQNSRAKQGFSWWVRAIPRCVCGKNLASQEIPADNLGQSWQERWLSGRKRRFAKPLYGLNRIGGSNPPLSANSLNSLQFHTFNGIYTRCSPLSLFRPSLMCAADSGISRQESDRKVIGGDRRRRRG